MKNKLFILIIAALFGTFIVESCVDDFTVGNPSLNKPPSVAVNEDTIFAHAQYAREFLWQAYNSIYDPFNDNIRYQLGDNPIDNLSDDQQSLMGWGDAKEVWYPGNYNAGWASGWVRDRMDYNIIWGPVRNCWLFIENVNRVPDMSADEKAQLTAEAKILIATFYYSLFRNVGGLPIVDHAYSATEKFQAPRATLDSTVQFMCKLLNEAADTPQLPFSLNSTTNFPFTGKYNLPAEGNAQWAGRMTRGAALAFKAKVLLFAASPLFNDPDGQPYSTESPQDAVTKDQVWYGKYRPDLWDSCRVACENFFAQNALNGNPFALIEPAGNTEADYRAAYRQAYWTRGNSEKIIESHTYTFQGEWTDQRPVNVDHQGAGCPTVEFMEKFPMADGTPFTDSTVFNTDNPNNIDIFAHRDPRLYETMLTQEQGQSWQNFPQVELWQGGNMQTANLWYYSTYLGSGMAPYKWCLDFTNLNVDPFSFSYLRMAEVYLIYAEALAETGDLQKACDEINIVRARVGLGKIEVDNPTLNLTTNKANLITEILRERECELGYEENRFFDMCRRKLANKFTTPLHGITIWRKDGKNQPLALGEPYPTAFLYKTYVFTIGARAWWNSPTLDPKWYLDALPIPEIQKGYGLTQNPGW